MEYKSYIDYAQKNQTNNMLHQLKAQGAVEMATCICMYNENKEMLQNTLFGVAENIQKLSKMGVDHDQLPVFIIVDGIEKID